MAATEPMGSLTLVLQPGEALIINDNVTVTFVKQKGMGVTMNVKAPLSVKVDREKIWLKRQKEKAHRGTSQQAEGASQDPYQDILPGLQL